jgi:hypothetical protein
VIDDNGSVRWVVVLWVLAACGDNIQVIEPSEFEAAYTAAVCRYYERCGIATGEACPYAYRLHPDTLAALDAGIVRWSYEVADACVAAVDRLDCDRTSALHREPACFGLVVGTKHDGEACAFGGECISRECWLEGASCTDACCIGYCTGDTPPAIGRIGDRCRFAPCAEGYCDGNLCQPTKPAGAACVLDAECDVGLGCEDEVCTVLPGTGEECDFACRNVSDRCNGICVPYALLGQRCYTDDECAPYYTCTSALTCALRYAGAPCGSYGATCPAPLACDRTNTQWRCVERKADGAPCYWSDECASGSCTLPRNETGTCTSETCI